MTETADNNGRLCNQIIRNICVSLIAEKNDLHVKYASYDRITQLGIPLFVGSKIYATTIPLHPQEYLEFLTIPIQCNLNPYDYYQTREICRLIHQYLNSPDLKKSIMDKNPFKERYHQNSDCNVHLRLGDVAHMNPGFHYYEKVLNGLSFDRLYLSTDQPDHEIVRKIREKYPSAILLNYNEVETIQFASTNKHVVLSHGSFSAIIGYLSFFSDVYYPEYEEGKNWYGDMFTIDGWNKVSNYRL